MAVSYIKIDLRGDYMKKEKNILKSWLLLTVFVLCLMMTVIASISCTCPVFSFIESITGVKVKAGEDVDGTLVDGELIYPDSTLLMQVEGDIDTIMEVIGRYGVIISERDAGFLNKLPEEIREQKINATIYSTADKKIKVLDYYYSFDKGGFDIVEFGKDKKAVNKNQPNVMIASNGEERESFVLIGTESNTFIIFLDFNWEILSEMGNNS